MTAITIIEAIKALSPNEQAVVIEFAITLAGTRALTPQELTALAQRMTESNDLAEVERLKTAITSGFNGEEEHA